MDFIDVRNYILILSMGFSYAFTVYIGTRIFFPFPSSPRHTKIEESEYKKLPEEEKGGRKKENNTNRDKYNNKVKEKEKKRLLCTLVVNIIALLAIFIFALFYNVQNGLLIGVFTSIVFTYGDYWSKFSNITQLLSLLVVLVVLIFGTYRMFIRKKKGN